MSNVGSPLVADTCLRENIPDIFHLDSCEFLEAVVQEESQHIAGILSRLLLHVGFVITPVALGLANELESDSPAANSCKASVQPVKNQDRQNGKDAQESLPIIAARAAPSPGGKLASCMHTAKQNHFHPILQFLHL